MLNFYIGYRKDQRVVFVVVHRNKHKFSNLGQNKRGLLLIMIICSRVEQWPECEYWYRIVEKFKKKIKLNFNDGLWVQGMSPFLLNS